MHIHKNKALNLLCKNASGVKGTIDVVQTMLIVVIYDLLHGWLWRKPSVRSQSSLMQDGPPVHCQV